MISFFRRLRQRMWRENRITRYLLYALGEIILVVIGILIALQVNNWNKVRIDEAAMNVYLHGILEDLRSDTIAYTKAVNRYTRIIDRKDSLLMLSDFEGVSTDSLSRLIMTYYSSYNINSTSFDKIINAGIADISTNVALSDSIYEYYTNKAEKFHSLIDWDVDRTGHEIDHWLYGQNDFQIGRDANLPMFQEEKERREGLIRLITSPKARNMLAYESFRKKRILTWYKHMRTSAENVIKDLEKELGE